MGSSRYETDADRRAAGGLPDGLEGRAPKAFRGGFAARVLMLPVAVALWIVPFAGLSDGFEDAAKIELKQEVKHIAKI